jgi:hypothetical protein
MATRFSQTSRMRSALITLAALVLVGCSPGLASPPPSVSQEGVPPAPTSTLVAEAAPVEAAPSPLPAMDEPSSSGPEPTPTLRVGLQATDPQTVVLGSGKPQLVEFFAYW